MIDRALGNHRQTALKVDAAFEGTGIKHQAVLGLDAHTGAGVGGLGQQQEQCQTGQQRDKL
jgi:hypothetical protein